MDDSQISDYGHERQLGSNDTGSLCGQLPVSDQLSPRPPQMKERG